VKKIKYSVLLLLISFILSSCEVTYKKETLTQDLEKLVEKEAREKSKAYIVGKTLYLDIKVDGLSLPGDREVFYKALRKVQIAGGDISRVVLSSNSDIKFMVVTAYDPAYTILFRVVQNIDDIKSYFYMRISRSDYESRSLIEMFGSSIHKIIRDKHDVSKEEFVGRIIATRLNAFQGAGVSVRYLDVRNKVLFLGVLETLGEKNVPLIEDFLKKQLSDYSKKYNTPFNSIEILDFKGRVGISVSLNY
jgi:hypothetical protein